MKTKTGIAVRDKEGLREKHSQFYYILYISFLLFTFIFHNYLYKLARDSRLGKTLIILDNVLLYMFLEACNRNGSLEYSKFLAKFPELSPEQSNCSHGDIVVIGGYINEKYSR